MVAGTPVLLLEHPELVSPLIAIRYDSGNMVLGYIHDRERGSIDQEVLGSASDMDSAFSAVRPAIRNLAARAASRGDYAGEAHTLQLVDLVSWALGDASEVKPRLREVINAFWGEGNWPEDPDWLGDDIAEAERFELPRELAELLFIRAVSQFREYYAAEGSQSQVLLHAALADVDQGLHCYELCGRSDTDVYKHFVKLAVRTREELGLP